MGEKGRKEEGRGGKKEQRKEGERRGREERREIKTKRGVEKGKGREIKIVSEMLVPIKACDTYFHPNTPLCQKPKSAFWLGSGEPLY